MLLHTDCQHPLFLLTVLATRVVTHLLLDERGGGGLAVGPIHIHPSIHTHTCFTSTLLLFNADDDNLTPGRKDTRGICESDKGI